MQQCWNLSFFLSTFRFCSSAYELDVTTGVLTKDPDLYAPDFTSPNIDFNIVKLHMPPAFVKALDLARRKNSCFCFFLISVINKKHECQNLK